MTGNEIVRNTKLQDNILKLLARFLSIFQADDMMPVKSTPTSGVFDVNITNGSINVVTSGSSTPSTPSKTTVNSSGTVAAGAISVTFVTSSTYAGTILGDTAQADAVYTFSDDNTLSAITYTVTAGSMEILKIV